MKINFQSPGDLLRRNRKTRIHDYDELIDQFPFAVVITDIESHHILKANQKSSTLTGYSIKQLESMNLGNLCDLNLFSKTVSNNQNPDSPSLILKRSHGDPISVQIQIITNPGNLNGNMIFLQKINNSEKFRLDSNIENDFGEKFKRLLPIFEQTEKEDAIDTILNEIRGLTGTNLVALYLGSQNNPVFQRKFMTGDGGESLPIEVFGNDLPFIQNSYLWQKGQRTTPITNLTLAARAGRFSYMASIPLARSGAVIGLLILADTVKSPAPNILSLGMILSDFIYSFIQVKLKFSNIKQELDNSEHKAFTHIITEEFIQEGVIELSPDLTIRKINPSAEAIFGYSNHEVQGQPVENILISSESFTTAFNKAQKGTDTIIIDQHRLFRRNGDDFLARFRILPVMDGNGINTILILVEDLSEKERIRIQTEELEQRAVLGEVTAIFAHEVRNPINNISTGLQWMARSLPAEDANQTEISRLLQDCDRLAELMKSVLSLTKPANYNMEAVDLSGLIQRLLNRRLTRLESSKINYDLQVQDQTTFVLGDLHALEQVFNNLINNSMQAMSETGGNLVIRIQSLPESSPNPVFPVQNEMVEISLADTGPGIPMEIQDKVFQPFFTTRASGTGLGLAIAKRIIIFHRGNINLESFPGGTIFKITLPAFKQG